MDSGRYRDVIDSMLGVPLKHTAAPFTCTSCGERYPAHIDATTHGKCMDCYKELSSGEISAEPAKIGNFGVGASSGPRDSDPGFENGIRRLEDS